jgi:hypothetical protein
VRYSTSLESIRQLLATPIEFGHGTETGGYWAALGSPGLGAARTGTWRTVFWAEAGRAQTAGQERAATIRAAFSGETSRTVEQSLEELRTLLREAPRAAREEELEVVAELLRTDSEDSDTDSE